MLGNTAMSVHHRIWLNMNWIWEVPRYRQCVKVGLCSLVPVHCYRIGPCWFETSNRRDKHTALKTGPSITFGVGAHFLRAKFRLFLRMRSCSPCYRIYTVDSPGTCDEYQPRSHQENVQTSFGSSPIRFDWHLWRCKLVMSAFSQKSIADFLVDRVRNGVVKIRKKVAFVFSFIEEFFW